VKADRSLELNMVTGTKSETFEHHDSDLSRPRSLADLRLLRGAPLTTVELARMIGMSSTFIREEIRSGHLRAVLLGRGRKRVYRIPLREALRYVNGLGLM
jgi:hypothetical protein